MIKDSQKDPATNPTALLATVLIDQVSLLLKTDDEIIISEVNFKEDCFLNSIPNTFV